MLNLIRSLMPASVALLLASETLILFFCYVLASALVIDVDLQFFLFEENGFFRISIVVASILVGLYLQDLYTKIRARGRVLFIQQTSMVLGIAFLVQALMTYISRDLMLPRWLMIYGSIFVFMALPVWRFLYLKFAVNTVGTQRVLLVGTSSVIQELAERLLTNPEFGHNLLGYVGQSETPDQKIPNLPLLGELPDLRQIVEAHKPERILIGMTERRARMPVQELLDMRLGGIYVEEAAIAYEQAFGRVCTRELRPSQLIFSTALGPSARTEGIHTALSAVIAVVGTILTIPIMIIVAILVRLTSPGPILHGQIRSGLNGKPFTVYKFRSMKANAEATTGAVWAQKNDPRITPIGKYLRKFRLDELPQFFNVLRGEMSMVGPRPERPEFVKTLSEKIPFYRQRLSVKPGITGWAQISHKYGDTVEDTITKLEYDLYYIKHLSLALDVYILLSTAKTVLLGRGAQ